MPINREHEEFDRLRHLHARAVRHSVALVDQVTADDLLRPTPCAAWTLGDLLAHMTAQHRGFAAAALGHGEDLARWAVRPLDPDVAAAYGEAAEQVIAAFAEVTAADQPFALPEFTRAQSFPAALAVGFHLLDYVVHGWDVARGLGLRYSADAELLHAALPTALAVPDGAFRLAPGSHFLPALATGPDPDPLDRILTALGRSPDWPNP
ncbi:TIGR03086 family metal-binding protein [Streptacidiphilus sp. EB129]|uniref:TIGR03086 family metal-binding protein n=1 Tax=Streptacidiphilus sp. EB129 TaxID=3156262 RepID=UPI0035158C91